MDDRPLPSEYPPYYPYDGTYADLLCWHLEYWGTRPDGNTKTNGKPWGAKDFRGAVFGDSGEKPSYVNGYGHWRGRGSAPLAATAVTIQNALFGDNPVFAEWRRDLDEALSRSRGKGNNPRTREYPLPPPPTVPRKDSIPRLTEHFIGRSAEVKTMVEALTADPPAHVLVEGGPGFGKTELTKAAARHADVVSRFECRRWFASLANATNAIGIQVAITRAVGLSSEISFFATLNVLREAPSLLVLDNIETPWEPFEEREPVAQLLATLGEIPGLAIVATVRGFERIDGLRWMDCPLAPLSGDDAATLFASIAGDQITSDPVLKDFINALGGIPLAVDLVARRARGRAGLATLWAEWERIGVDFAKRSDASEGPLTSLPHSIELSLRGPRITESGEAKRLFRFLGKLPGGVAPVDRDALMGGSAYDAEDLLLITGLAIERSGRLDLLPPIRSHAAQYWLPNAEDKAAWIDQYLDVASRHAQLPDEAIRVKFDGIEDDFLNAQAAIAVAPYGQAADAFDSLARLSQRLWRPMLRVGELLSASEQRDDKPMQAKCLTYIGNMFMREAENGTAVQVLNRALAIYTEAQDISGEAFCWAGMAAAACVSGYYEYSRTFAEHALARFQALQDVTQIARCYLQLADANDGLGHSDVARENYSDALRRFQQLDDELGQARCLRALGHLALRHSLPEAESHLKAASNLFTKCGDIRGQAISLADSAMIAAHRNDVHAAIELISEALVQFQTVVFDQTEIANCYQFLGDIAFKTAGYDIAACHYQTAASCFEKLQNKFLVANCKRMLGNIAMRQEHYNDALAMFEEVIGLYRDIEHTEHEATVRQYIDETLLPLMEPRARQGS